MVKESFTTFLFDLGSVLIDIDPQATIDSLQYLFEPTYVHSSVDIFSGEALNGGYASDFLNKYQLGKISTRQFINHIKSYCKPGTTDDDIISAWMKMMIGMDGQTSKFLQDVSAGGFEIYILSNINELHVEWIRRNIPQLEVAKQCFFSNEMHLAKPDKECYEFVLSHTPIIPQQTLYFDDLSPNIEMGEKIGFKSVQVYDKSWISQAYEILNTL